jgi:hypothetical protein
MPAILGRVTAVTPHPDSNSLDVVTIGGFTNVANRAQADRPRYAVGDYAVILQDNLVLPDWLLRHLDLWDNRKGKGVLAGNRGNRTKGRRIAGVMSDVALVAVDWQVDETPYGTIVLHQHAMHLPPIALTNHADSPVGLDLTAALGITEYVPP